MASVIDTSQPAAFRPEQAAHLGTGTQTPGYDLATERRADDGETANALGWFSVGLGLLELVAARPLGRALGMKKRANLIRLYGLREIGTGVGIFSQRRPLPYIQARIAGAALDLATLAAALPGNRKRGNVLGALAAVAGVTALDVLCAKQLAQPRVQPGAAANES